MGNLLRKKFQKTAGGDFLTHTVSQLFHCWSSSRHHWKLAALHMKLVTDCTWSWVCMYVCLTHIYIHSINQYFLVTSAVAVAYSMNLNSTQKPQPYTSNYTNPPPNKWTTKISKLFYPNNSNDSLKLTVTFN